MWYVLLKWYQSYEKVCIRQHRLYMTNLTPILPWWGMAWPHSTIVTISENKHLDRQTPAWVMLRLTLFPGGSRTNWKKEDWLVLSALVMSWCRSDALIGIFPWSLVSTVHQCPRRHFRAWGQRRVQRFSGHLYRRPLQGGFFLPSTLSPPLPCVMSYSRWIPVFRTTLID